MKNSVALNSIENLRAHFPALQRRIKNNPLVYLDSAATSLKPKLVVDRMNDYLLYGAANVHRGAHFLSREATEHFENSRNKVANFIGAKNAEDIIFTRGTTESINLVASSFGEFLQPGDEILLSQMEHHSNIVPWQLLAQRKGLEIKVCQLDPSHNLDLQDFQRKFSKKTKIVAISACSNVLGTMPDILAIRAIMSSQTEAVLLLDAAQFIVHAQLPKFIDKVDFLCFSGHKMFAPTGIGVLYGKTEWLQKMGPYQGGGSMIDQVSFQGTSFLKPPNRFEAGTPAIAEAIGLGAAIDYIESLDFLKIRQWEKELYQIAFSGIEAMGGLIYGQQPDKAPILSFNFPNIHHSDLAQILDQQGVAIRAGHHCCQPLMEHLKTNGCARASISIYNSKQDINLFLEAVEKAVEMLK